MGEKREELLRDQESSQREKNEGGKKMKKQITIGIAALLLGLVLSVPLRVNALEDEKSIIEGEITEPRRGSARV